MKKLYINEEFCLGCGLCEVYCQVKHSKSKDIIKAFKGESPPPVSGLSVERQKPLSFAVTCRHCTEPYCVYACLTGALHRNPENGIVTVDADRCTGCWTCLLACPFGVIKRNTERGKIAKCDLCGGEEVPACVANCPNEALIYA